MLRAGCRNCVPNGPNLKWKGATSSCESLIPICVCMVLYVLILIRWRRDYEFTRRTTTWMYISQVWLCDQSARCTAQLLRRLTSPSIGWGPLHSSIFSPKFTQPSVHHENFKYTVQVSYTMPRPFIPSCYSQFQNTCVANERGYIFSRMLTNVAMPYSSWRSHGHRELHHTFSTSV